MAAELTTYITNAREKNVTDEEIKNHLISAGWQPEQVAQALSQQTDLPVPPPPPSIAHVGMWTGFLYILFFVSLYVLATSVTGIFHIWIDKAIPSTQTTSFFTFESSSITRGYIAAIIVSYPLFLALSFALKRQMLKQPAVKNIRSRKILIYITLIGTFLIMLGDIIATSYAFLAGTVTDNVIRHLLVTFLIAGSIFYYFILEVKNDRNTT